MKKETNFSDKDVEEVNDGKEGLRILAKMIARRIFNEGINEKRGSNQE